MGLVPRGSLGRLGACVATAALVVLLAAPVGAWATRYASQTGTSAESCASPATACDLRTAIEGKVGNEPKSGEEVIVEPGTYNVTSKIEPQVPTLQVRGAPGLARPLIKSKKATIFGTEFGGRSLNLSHVAVEQTELSSGLPAIFLSGATIEGVLLIGEPSGNVLCDCYEGTIKDSVIIARKASSSGAVGILANGGSATETLRNDTIVSESPEQFAGAIELDQQSKVAGLLTLNAYNTIAIDTAGGSDVIASERSTITMHNSDYAHPSAEGSGSVVNAGGRVEAPPLFVNAAAGNFAEAAGSPTIDKGLNEEANGPFDYEGKPRISGAATDIGAYELQVPAPPSKEVERPGSSSGKGSSPPPRPLSVAVATQSNRKWREAKRRHGRMLPIGTTFVYLLDEPASVTLTFERQLPGRKVRVRCVAKTHRNAHKPRCTRFAAAGTVTASGGSGLNAVYFRGRTSTGTLAPGAYRVVVSATAAGQRASAAALTFTIVA